LLIRSNRDDTAVLNILSDLPISGNSGSESGRRGRRCNGALGRSGIGSNFLRCAFASSFSGDIDQKPQSGLVPKFGTMERYRLMEALNFASSEIHKQIGALFNPKLTAEMKEIQLGVIGRRFDALEKLLEGKQFIAGDKFTVADAYLFTVINWTNIHKIDLAKWPNIKAFMARIGARPKVQETMKAEGLVQ
jgi:hypothetical protein